MDFLHFWPSKIYVSPIDVVFSLSPPRCCLSSSRHHHIIVTCHASFTWSQDEFAASASSSSNVSSHHISSRVKTKVLNLHRCRRPPSPNSPTSTLHCYKQVISTLVTLPITQLCLYFASSAILSAYHLNLGHSPNHSTVKIEAGRAPHHRSSICLHRSLSPSSQTYRPFIKWHSHWWTSWSSFAFWIIYRHVNLYKKYFKISQHHAGLSISP
jgi:hypothetical protein